MLSSVGRKPSCNASAPRPQLALPISFAMKQYGQRSFLNVSNFLAMLDLIHRHERRAVVRDSREPCRRVVKTGLRERTGRNGLDASRRGREGYRCVKNVLAREAAGNGLDDGLGHRVEQTTTRRDVPWRPR